MNTLKIKSWLTSFFSILKSSNIFFIKIIFDYIKIKKIISQKHSSVIINLEYEETESFEKYFVLRNNFIQLSLLRAINLDLHKKSNELSILDLGTGAGYFPLYVNTLDIMLTVLILKVIIFTTIQQML